MKNRFIWTFIISVFGVGCGGPIIPNGGLKKIWHSLPNSRYLSKQDSENVRVDPNQRRGYDPHYRMLRYRDLENVRLNPPYQPADPEHISGLRVNGKILDIPDPSKDLISSKQLVDQFIALILQPENQFEKRYTALKNRRNDFLKQGSKPSTIISGLGPVGLLAVLEAYTSGSAVVGIEQRSQYTRPQILRLTEDTINEMKGFLGHHLWENLRQVGVVSQSPNWVPNKYDVDNEYIYFPSLSPQLSLARFGFLTPSEVIDLQKMMMNFKSQIVFSSEELNEKASFELSGRELRVVDILRINHLETLLAAMVELLAKRDPESLKIYYGGTLKATSRDGAYVLSMELASGAKTSEFPIEADVIGLSEGFSQTSVASVLGLKSSVVSDTLYGSTTALRLPKGFDIALRPIENREGTASVKGIAKIDQEKLGTFISGPTAYQWSMIGERQLCNQLNDVLVETAQKAGLDPLAAPDFMLPCLKPKENSALLIWEKRNGGTGDIDEINGSFLPRTRYFFTGGIAYMGAELTQSQYEFFERRNDRTLHEATRKDIEVGHRKFMLELAKKHMPQEYVTGQNGINTVNEESLSSYDELFYSNDFEKKRPLESSYEEEQSEEFPLEQSYFEGESSDGEQSADWRILDKQAEQKISALADKMLRSLDTERTVTVTEAKYSVTTFPITLRRADEFVSIRNFLNPANQTKAIKVVRMGDSFATTHFFTGSGAVNGLRSAIAFGQAIQSNDWNESGRTVNNFTDKMHDRVMKGSGDAPLDGPFNSAF